jgi:GT2 family glycosyltransferase
MPPSAANNSGSELQAQPSVLAALVLYKTPADASEAFSRLQQARREDRRIHAAITCAVFDNTPYPQQPPADFDGVYVQDLNNVGLARRYNRALALAKEAGIEWLLLLDQDTQLTRDYLEEVLHLTSAPDRDPRIVAFAPRLLQQQELLSPRMPPAVSLRSPENIRKEEYGPIERRVQVFNSGAVLSVAALEAIGGFPEEFWLDGLDHVVFHKLQKRGGKVFLMHSQLQHDLSAHRPGEAIHDGLSGRELNALKASRDFAMRYAPLGEKLHFLVHMGRLIGGALRHHRKQSLRSFLRVFTER